MTELLVSGRLAQISRSVSDIGASEAWYRDVLGLPHLYTFGTLSFFDCGGTRLFLSQGRAREESLLYFKVDSVETAYRRLSALGVCFVEPPHVAHRHNDGTEEWLAIFNDPDGRPLALMAQNSAAPPT